MSEWTESWGGWLLRTSIEGSILIVTVLGLSWMLGRYLGPRWRVVLWTLVGLKLVIPAFIPATPGLGNWLAFHSPSAEVVEARFPTPQPVLSESPVEIPVAEPTVLKEMSVKPIASVSIERMIAGIWLLGALAFLAAMMVRHRRFFAKAGQNFCQDRRLLALVREVAGELGVRRDIFVLMGPANSTPAVLGARQPRLLLPADWEQRFDRDSLRHILMHEIEHIRYRDVLWNWFAAAVNAVHWFNPLVWIAVSRFQADRELRCDADTVARMEPAERIAYGKTLLRVQREFLAAPATAGVAPCVRNHPTLQQRILMITNPTDKKSWLSAILTLAIAGLIWFSFGAASADDERNSREGSRERSAEREGGASREGEREGSGRSRESARDGEREGAGRSREGDGDKPREGSREGDRPREGSREGDRPREGDREGGSREGARDGEGALVRDGELKVSVSRDGVVIGDKKVTLINLRRELDGSKAKSAVIFAQPDTPFQNVTTVMNSLKNSGIKDIRIGNLDEGEKPMRRDGEGGPSREGARDGEGARRTGPRDGEGPPRTGPRDGEGPPAREGARDGDRPREGGTSREGARDAGSASSAEMSDKQRAQLNRIYRAYDKNSNDEVTFDEWVAMKNYELSSDQKKREKGWFDQADANNDEVLTVKEWQTWKLSQGKPAAREGEGSRDGDRPREGSRDGDKPSREGARDGDRPREGTRDGDQPRREGSRDGDRPREGSRAAVSPDAEGTEKALPVYWDWASGGIFQLRPNGVAAHSEWTGLGSWKRESKNKIHVQHPNKSTHTVIVIRDDGTGDVEVSSGGKTRITPRLGVLPVYWDWASGGVFQLRPNGVAVHSEWTDSGSWKWESENKIQVQHPNKFTLMEIVIRDDGTGDVEVSSGGKTRISPRAGDRN